MKKPKEVTMGKTYKVKLTEKEARSLGERRWMKVNERRYVWWILGILIALLGVGILFGGAVGFPTWGALSSIVFLVGMLFFIYLRMSGKAATAGKAFIQSLEEEK